VCPLTPAALRHRLRDPRRRQRLIDEIDGRIDRRSNSPRRSLSPRFDGYALERRDADDELAWALSRQGSKEGTPAPARRHSPDPQTADRLAAGFTSRNGGDRISTPSHSSRREI